MKFLAPAAVLALASQAATAPIVGNAIAQRDVNAKPSTVTPVPEPYFEFVRSALKDQSLIDARDIARR